MNADIKRVYENIATLLQHGVFPGQVAGPLAEAQQFVANFLLQLAAATPVATSTEVSAHDGNQTNEA